MTVLAHTLTGFGPARRGPTFVGLSADMAPLATAGEILRRERRARSLSLAQVATRTGIDKTSISDYETDKVVPDHETLIRLLSGMGAPAEPVLAAMGYPIAAPNDFLAMAETAIVSQPNLKDEHRSAALVVVRELFASAKAEKTFTQADIDRIVQDRLARQRKEQPA